MDVDVRTATIAACETSSSECLIRYAKAKPAWQKLSRGSSDSGDSNVYIHRTNSGRTLSRSGGIMGCDKKQRNASL